jgi:hypothetical protein
MRRLLATLALTVALVLSALPAFASGGGAGDDVIHGTPGNDSLYGGAGNDTIRSGGGQDSVWGGPGYDVCYVGSRDLFIGCEVVK